MTRRGRLRRFPYVVYYELFALTLLGDVAARFGEARLVLDSYREFQPFSGTLVVVAHSVTIAGPQDHRLGILAHASGRFVDAANHFEAAIELARQTGAIPWVAHAQYSYAEMLLERGEPEDKAKAAAFLGRAREIARAFKMLRLQRQLRELDS